jgi:hypothetical protein
MSAIGHQRSAGIICHIVAGILLEGNVPQSDYREVAEIDHVPWGECIRGGPDRDAV